MKVIDREYVESHKEEILKAIREGSIFIYPTDTIYGLGCNALMDNSVEKIRYIKHRESKAFSVIAPSKEWIEEKCLVSRAEMDNYLPGPYTLIVKRMAGAVSKTVNPNDGTLGVRIPDHWFTAFVSEAGVPFVTTSVNATDEPYMAKIEDVGKEILDQVDYVVYEGENSREPSTKINLVSTL